MFGDGAHRLRARKLARVGGGSGSTGDSLDEADTNPREHAQVHLSEWPFPPGLRADTQVPSSAASRIIATALNTARPWTRTLSSRRPFLNSQT